VKIGAIAQRVGVSVSALRLYEQRGLVATDRSPGGTRQYGEEELERFHAIVGLTRAEVRIEDLARLAGARSANSSGDTASRQVEDILAEVEAGLTTRLERLQNALLDIQQARSRLEGCHGCSRRPTRELCAGCPVADKLLACSVMRVVWDQGTRDERA
jgi:DNA-binding transcriptional MerR regulator